MSNRDLEHEYHEAVSMFDKTLPVSKAEISALAFEGAMAAYFNVVSKTISNRKLLSKTQAKRLYLLFGNSIWPIIRYKHNYLNNGGLISPITTLTDKMLYSLYLYYVINKLIMDYDNITSLKKSRQVLAEQFGISRKELSLRLVPGNRPSRKQLVTFLSNNPELAYLADVYNHIISDIAIANGFLILPEDINVSEIPDSLHIIRNDVLFMEYADNIMQQIINYRNSDHTLELCHHNVTETMLPQTSIDANHNCLSVVTLDNIDKQLSSLESLAMSMQMKLNTL